MKTCDLHTHSLYSDGTWTPQEIIREGERAGLAAVALTDHNSIAGLPEFICAAEGRRIRPVPGVEFSADFEGREVHILALLLKPEVFNQVNEFLKDYLRRREQSCMELIRRLGRAGLRLDYEKLKSSTPGGYVNRAHIASGLVKIGAVSNMQEAFPRYLNEAAGYYSPAVPPDAIMLIKFILSLKAVPVFAHPFRSLSERDAAAFLKKAVPEGLAAMEVLYSEYDSRQTGLAMELCREFSLLPSGGTDFHGGKKPEINLGTGHGGLSVPYDFLLDMEAFLRN